jgi:hypothetical protein
VTPYILKDLKNHCKRLKVKRNTTMTESSKERRLRIIMRSEHTNIQHFIEILTLKKEIIAAAE